MINAIFGQKYVHSFKNPKNKIDWRVFCQIWSHHWVDWPEYVHHLLFVNRLAVVLVVPTKIKILRRLNAVIGYWNVPLHPDHILKLDATYFLNITFSISLYLIFLGPQVLFVLLKTYHSGHSNSGTFRGQFALVDIYTHTLKAHKSFFSGLFAATSSFARIHSF